MRVLIAFAFLVLGSSPAATAPPIFSEVFEWPTINPSVIPDARLGTLIHDAREAARNAATRASNAKRLVAQLHRRKAVRGFFGANDHPMTIAAGTVMTATRLDGESSQMLGDIAYPDGATMTGLFGPDEGIYTSPPETLLATFAGWVWGAASSNPQPMDGVFTFRNGDSFTGSAGQGEGIYSFADGERRFVGKVDLEHSSFRPIAGILEDRKGRLLAVILP